MVKATASEKKQVAHADIEYRYNLIVVGQKAASLVHAACTSASARALEQRNSVAGMMDPAGTKGQSPPPPAAMYKTDSEASSYSRQITPLTGSSSDTEDAKITTK